MIPTTSPSRPDQDAQAALDQALANAPTSADLAVSRADDYRVCIPTFEGPLDLLLHLIRKDQLNIYDIPIATICKSYVDYIDLMHDLDVNVAGEFMVMAATLTLMKSAVLLPQESNENGEEEDPRLPLVQQLLEYEKFKQAAQRLDQEPWLYRDIYPRPPGAIQSQIPTESLLTAPLDPIDTFQLLICLKTALDRTTRPPLQISLDPVSLKDKVLSVQDLMRDVEILEFRALLPTVPRRQDNIDRYLTNLELAKLKFLEILQTEALGPIQIRAVRSLDELDSALLDQY
jgi:segregation and condensation protein A